MVTVAIVHSQCTVNHFVDNDAASILNSTLLHMIFGLYNELSEGERNRGTQARWTCVALICTDIDNMTRDSQPFQKAASEPRCPNSRPLWLEQPDT